MRLVPAIGWPRPGDRQVEAVLPVFGGDPRVRLAAAPEPYRGRRAFRAAMRAGALAVEERLGARSPALDFAELAVVQIAYCDIWRASGVELNAAAGVGIGEVSAAYALGALSREEALRVACAVARTQAARVAGKCWFAVRAGSALAKCLCRTAPVRLEFAGSTGPRSSLVAAQAGEAAAAREHLASGTTIEREHEFVAVGGGTRSPDEPPTPRAELEDIVPRLWSGRLYSAAAGGALPDDARLDALHWHWVARRPFYLDEAAAAARTDGLRSTLTVPGEAAGTRATVRTLRRFPPPKAPRAAGTEAPASVPPVRALDDGATWLVLGRDEVRFALTRPDLFSSGMWAEIDSSLLSLDPPEHTRPRKAITPFLSSKATKALGATADQTAHELLRRQAASSEFDAVSDLADPLVETVTGRLIGLDDTVVPVFAARVKNGGQEPELGRIEEALKDLPDPPALVEELASSASMDRPQAARLVRFLWLSGVVTSRRVIPRAILTLWEHPEIRGRVVTEPTLLSRFVDEVLRLHPPEQVMARVATCDTTLGGVPIPAGSVVQLSLGAANRDPGWFAEPARVRLDRRPGHIAFGAGPHRCPGAGIGRANVLAALSAMVAIMPEFEIVHPRCMRRHGWGPGAAHATTVLEDLIVAPGPLA